MANELEITQAEMNNELDESINNATAIITKNYLDKLETLDIIAPSAAVSYTHLTLPTTSRV